MTSRKSSIMLILLLLVSLFIAGMWLISGLNLNFAQQAMTEQRQRQIADTFHANLARINTHHFLMQRNTAALARHAELLLRQQRLPGQSNLAELKYSVSATLADLTDVHGGSILFHPGSYRAEAFAVHAHRESSSWQVSSQPEAFSDQSWYRDIVQQRGRSSPAQRSFHWSAAYYKPEIEEVVISISTPLLDQQNRVAGLAVIVGVMLLLSGIILYLVANTLRQLNSLYTDALTSLPNREKLLQDLHRERPATLILLNIDAFREINDFYGSACGDQVIREVAAGLLDHLARTPLGGEAQLYHMHADEMAVLLPLPEHPAQFTRWLDSLHHCISTLSIQWQGQTIPLQATLGLAATDQSSNPPIGSQQLVASANIAVKMARLQKLNYLIHDPAHGLRETYEQNLLWANRLRVALEEQRIVPWFQPILNLRTGRIDKYECLVRMLDENGDSIAPATFLPVARKIRLYRLITRCMVDQCFARFADSSQQFSLNLSCDDLLDEELSEYILQRLQDRALAQRVIFEILESEGIENYRQVRAFIDRAKALGCRIAIDDFGTGYSNFEHLMRLDVDLIKIDGSLIKRLHRDPTARVLAEGIVRFARELGLQTVAEFVHSEAVLKQVKELQIDFAQGAYIGMPAPTPDAAELYSTGQRR